MLCSVGSLMPSTSADEADDPVPGSALQAAAEAVAAGAGVQLSPRGYGVFRPDRPPAPGPGGGGLSRFRGRPVRRALSLRVRGGGGIGWGGPHGERKVVTPSGRES